MRIRSVSWFLLATGVLILLAIHGLNPQLYTILDEPSGTGYHTDIRVVRESVVNSSFDILPVMQDLLDFSGTIAVTIRKKDLDTAGEELTRYQRRFQDLDNLILKLDMNESEVADFSRNAQPQNDLLRQFVNTSESLESLKRLEVQYRADENPESLTTVRLQGKALESKLRSLRGSYDSVTDSITSRAGRGGLDIRTVLKGREEIANYTREVAADQDARDRRYADTAVGRPAISLLVQPGVVPYGETIDIYGFISGENPSNQPVWIFIDTIPPFLTITGETGEVRDTYTVGKILAGNHTVSAYWEETFSESRNITIPISDTTLTLAARAVKNHPRVNITGLLTARNPVQSAPVIILLNNRSWETVLTDKAGQYEASVEIPQGSFTLYTVFDNSSFPLNSSVSGSFDIVSTGTSISSVQKSRPPGPDLQWVALLLLPGFIGAAWWYLRRSRQPPGPDPDDAGEGAGFGRGLPVPDPVQVDGSPSLPPQTQSEKARLLYQDLVSRISGEIPASRLLVLTPRELIGRLTGHRYESLIRSFVREYERIRYGGEERDDDLEELEVLIRELGEEEEERDEG